MPLRGFHRSQSEAMPPSERDYRRAAQELRDFHRARSLDVILEEDHCLVERDSAGSSSGGSLKKKSAVLCLADLVEQQDQDASENSADDQQRDGEKDPSSWGHFAVDSPSEHCSTTRPRPIPRTFRRFGRS